MHGNFDAETPIWYKLSFFFVQDPPSLCQRVETFYLTVFLSFIPSFVYIGDKLLFIIIERLRLCCMFYEFMHNVLAQN